MNEEPHQVEIKKPGRRTPPLLVIGLVVLGLLICAGVIAAIVGGAFLLTQGVADAGSEFMTAIRDDNLQAAYDLFAPELKAELDYEGFQLMFAERDLQSWRFNSRSVENNRGELRGSATFAAGELDVILSFIRQDGEWRLIAFSFNE